MKRLAGAAALAAALVAWIPSCADVLGLGGERNVADELCDLLRRCYGDAVPDDCKERVGRALADADSDVAADWLTGFADADCLSDCSSARRCLDVAPVCAPVGGDCSVLEECCGFTLGKGRCDEAADRCCRPRGTSCSGDSDCCPDAGRCSEETGTCGGVVCKDAGAECALGAECCTKLCAATGRCADSVCQLDGAPCLEDFECCTNLCQDGACGIPGCGGESAPCFDAGECCPGLTCFAAAEGLGVCSTATCFPDGLQCKEPAECCSGYCDPDFGVCSSVQKCVEVGEPCDPGQICCSGVCNESFLCGCAGDGFACTFATDCCSGICEGYVCGVPGCSDWGESCETDEDCCGGTCNGDACVWGCGSARPADFQCQDDLCTTSNHPLDPSCADLDGECVATICQVDSFCCCDHWDDQCVAEVPTFCMQEC